MAEARGLTGTKPNPTMAPNLTHALGQIGEPGHPQEASSRKPSSTLMNFRRTTALFALLISQDISHPAHPPFPVINKGEKQLFADDLMIRDMRGVERVAHPAKKLAHPVLKAEMPWEQKLRDGVNDRRVNI